MADQQSTYAGLRELALFAGAGGGILGGKLLGWETVCAVEWGEYPASVLCARQNEGLLPPFPIWDDVQTFDGKPWRGIVDVVSGGFPCQDISVAGKGAGIDGERSGMWSHMARIIGEVRPRFAFVENSPALVSRGLGRVLGDLAALGYDCRWGVLGAVDVGANHQRDRFWLVATDTTIAGLSQRGQAEQPTRHEKSSCRLEQESKRHCDAAYTMCNGCRQRQDEHLAGQLDTTPNASAYGTQKLVAETDSAQRKRNQCTQRTQPQYADACGSGWWAVEPDVGRTSDELACELDKFGANK